MPTPRPEASGKEDMKYANEAQATGVWCPLDRRPECSCLNGGVGRKNGVVAFDTLTGSRRSAIGSAQYMRSRQKLPKTL